MNRKDIEQWTREAGGFDATPEFLAKFAALAVSAEREACAKVVETLWDTPTNGMATEEQFYGNECAKVIRARGQA